MLPGDAALSTLYSYPGPYVSVYLDATAGRAPEDATDDELRADAEERLDERWSHVRDSLADGDVDEDTLDAIEESLTSLAATGNARGVAVIAARGDVCLAAALAVPPPTSLAGVSALPDVVPYLRLRSPDIANLVVRAEAGRARLQQLLGHGLADLSDWQPLTGDDHAAAVVRLAARQAARSDPRTVIAVGDSASLGLVVERLERSLVTEMAVGAVEPGVRGLQVFDVIVAALLDRQRRDEQDLLTTVGDSIGHRGMIAVGPRDVAAALRNAQADIVVLNDSVLGNTSWVGPRPTEFGVRDQEARSVGVREIDHAPLGSAIVRAALATGAAVVLADEAQFAAPQGVVAHLRRP